jgi:hypothetical protein
MHRSVFDAVGQIGSVDPIQNEAMHDKTDRKNDAEDGSDTDL